MAWLREKAKERIKTYTESTLPHLFDKSLLGLTQILREATKFERNRILSLQLAKECISARMDLASNSDVIDKTALFVTKTQGIGSTRRRRGINKRTTNTTIYSITF